MTRPNILLIVFDTARADAFEPYGASAGASPAVADLASAGGATPATFATACWTVPSHLSMFTGLLPRSAGFHPTGMADYVSQVERVRARMLPSVLSRNGYETLGLSTNLWISGVTGFDTAFDEFAFVRGWRHRKLSAAGWRTRLRWYREGLRARVDDGAKEAGDRLDSWVSRRGKAPFFAFVNLIECHSPYLPPKPYNDLRALDRLRAAREARRHLTLSPIWKCATGGFDVPDEALARMRHLYRASVRQLDDWLARLLERLDRSGVLADTQVVVTSDHGENFGEGRMLGHAFSLDDRLLRVPLVTAGPHSLPEEGIFSLRDVPRWLAQIAGVGDQPFLPGEESVAVAQLDTALKRGDPRVQEATRAWDLEGPQAEEAARRLTTAFSCATDGGVKLIRRLGREELVDLGKDPFEERPVTVGAIQEREYASRLPALRAALDRAENETASPAPADEAGEGQAKDAVPTKETAELEAQMRLLGYL